MTNINGKSLDLGDEKPANPEHTYSKNIETMCEMLLQVLTLAETQFNAIETAAREDKYPLAPNGLHVPVREYVRNMAETGRDAITHILNNFDRENH